MITVTLHGGLGNQMFQYATGRAVADRTGGELCLDLVWLRYPGKLVHGTPRSYELPQWQLSAPHRVTGIGTHVQLHLRRRSRIVEHGPFSYEPAIERAPDGSWLNGYWHDARYFEQIRSDLLSEFKPRREANPQNTALLRRIDATESVSVHIRRGDYSSDPKTREYHGLPGLPYYEAAVGALASKVASPQFYVFSDDIDWCRRNLSLGGPTTFVGHNRPEDACWDIALMSHCRHNIIANSSFSWWGAWLNENPHKLVVAPRAWVNDPSVDTDAVTPRDWLRLGPAPGV